MKKGTVKRANERKRAKAKPLGVTTDISRSVATRAVAAATHWFKDPNVLSIGIGYKYRQSSKLPQLSLVVGVRRKIYNQRTIAGGYFIPKVLEIPKKGTAPAVTIETDVVQKRAKYFAAASDNPIGTKIQPKNGQTYGTFGAAVEDQNAKIYLLSCTHVLTDFGRVGEISEPIVDLNTGETLATLSRYSYLFPGYPNYADAALAQIVNPRILKYIKANQDISGIAEVSQNDPVKIVGAESGVSSGSVSQTTVTEKVFGWAGNPNEYCLMADQIELSNVGVQGDSGAIVRNNANKAVAIFVGDNGDHDLATPIRRALQFVSRPDSTVHDDNDTLTLTLEFL